MRSTSSLYLFLLSIFLIVFNLPAVSCQIKGFKEKPYPTPRVIAYTPSGIQQGDVTLSYTLIEVDGSGSDISLQYSSDGGSSWHSATAKGGDGTTNVKGILFPGVRRTIIWDTIADGVATSTCRVKITASKSGSGVKGLPDETGDFTVQNPPWPVISWVSKPEGVIREVPLTFTWKLDTPSTPIARYVYGLDEDPPTNETTNTSVTVPAPSLGAHTFRVFAQSTLLQNSNILEATFTCDNAAANQAPSVVITNGPSGTTYDNTPTFEYIGGDSDGYVTGYFVSIDVNPPDFWTTQNSWTSPELSCGSYTFYVKAQDNDGANSSVEFQEFTVDMGSTPSGPSWAIQVGNFGDDICSRICTLPDDTIYITGRYIGDLTLGEGEPAETTLPYEGWGDIFLARYTPNGNLVWAKKAGGEDTESPRSIAAHAGGTFCITGTFDNYSIFGKGEPGQTTLYTSGSDDVFIAKYNSDGTCIWARKDGGAWHDYGLDVYVSPDGSMGVTGYYQRDATFGQGDPTVTTLSAKGSSGSEDIFVAKYDSNGVLVWAKSAGYNYNDQGHGITSCLDGSFAVTGYIVGNAVFGEGEPGVTTLYAEPAGDIFVAKYSGTDGSLIWAKRAGGDNINRGTDICSDVDGSILVTGYFFSSSTFGPGETGEVVLQPKGGYDIFVAKYASNGLLLWARSAGGPEDDFGSGISVFADGSVCITGSFRNSAIFGEGDTNQVTLDSEGVGDAFIAKYNPDGTIAWVEQAGGTDYESCEGVSVLSDESITAIGIFKADVTFWSGKPGEIIFNSNGNNDIFLARFFP